MKSHPKQLIIKAGLEITAAQWTMSGLIGELTGQLSVILTGVHEAVISSSVKANYKSKFCIFLLKLSTFMHKDVIFTIALSSLVAGNDCMITIDYGNQDE